MANFALVVNNNILEIHDEFPHHWKNVSNLHLVEDPNILNHFNWHVIIHTDPLDTACYPIYEWDGTFVNEIWVEMSC